MQKSIACKQGTTLIQNSKIEYRQALLAARRNRFANKNKKIEEALSQQIQALLDERQPNCIAFYWPLIGEFDLRILIKDWLCQSSTRQAALPVIENVQSPLVFYAWTPDISMKPGMFQIPIPSPSFVVQPDLLLIPCLGFNDACYRLGYGGGYYDRTLKAIDPRPFAVGIAYEDSRLPHLLHEAHDVKLDCIVSESRRYIS